MFSSMRVKAGTVRPGIRMPRLVDEDRPGRRQSGTHRDAAHRGEERVCDRDGSLRLSAGRQQPYTPGEEGLQDHRIMEAIYESARTGRPVKLQDASKLDAFRGPDA
jgi:predicted dehydrogenase